MSLSVIIPTHRQRQLRYALRALVRQSERSFEVLVVENGVRDRSARDLCARFSGKLDLRYAYSSVTGLNRARNLGVMLARHPLIALLDDDCEPARDWVKCIIETHRAFPDAGAVGGPVSLAEHPVPPAWLAGRFREMLSELRWGARQKWLKSSEWLCGANLSFRRDVHEAAGGFPENLGMVGRTGPQLGNDEIAFLRKLRTLPGRRIRYHPGIAVTHRVGRQRMTIDYLESRFFGQGFSDLVLEQLAPDSVPWPQVWRRMSWAFAATHWFSEAPESADRMPADDRRRYAVNLLRARLAYLNGYRQACLAPRQAASAPRSLTAVESRYYAAGLRSAARSRRRAGNGFPGRLVELSVNLLGKRRSIWNRSDEASAAAVFGRLAFVSAVVDVLGSRKGRAPRRLSAGRLRDSERFLERLLFAGGPRRQQTAAAILDWCREHADEIAWSRDDAGRARVSGFTAKIHTRGPGSARFRIVSVWANGMVEFPVGEMPGRGAPGSPGTPGLRFTALSGMTGDSPGASRGALGSLSLDQIAERDVRDEVLRSLGALAARLRYPRSGTTENPERCSGEKIVGSK